MELLVVTSVIAVLAGLILTAVGKVQNDSRAMREVNAGRQLIAAYLTYTQDHDGELMSGYDKATQRVELSNRVISGEMCARYPWRLALYLAEQVDEIYLLNDNKKFTEHMDKTSFEYLYRISLNPAFGMNSYCVGGYESGTGMNYFQTDVVRTLGGAHKPSNLVVFTSARMKASRSDEAVPGNFIVQPPRFFRSTWSPKFEEDQPAANYGNVDLRWSGKAVCAFLDGHVEMLNNEQLRDSRRWSNMAAENNDPGFIVPR